MMVQILRLRIQWILLKEQRPHMIHGLATGNSLLQIEMLTDPDVTGTFKGLHLPKDVVDKFYFKNAQNGFRTEQ